MSINGSIRLAMGCALVGLLALGTQAAVTNGWNKSDAGPYDYNDSGNWVGGVNNGVWDASLAVTQSQVIAFNTDTVLTTPLAFNYASNFPVFFKTDGAGNRTLTLGGDITVAPQGGSAAAVTLGNSLASYNLNVDLGGLARTFTVSANHELTFVNTLSDGGILAPGAGTLTLSGSNTFAGGISLQAGQLKMGNPFGFGTGPLTLGTGTKVDVTQMTATPGATYTNANNNTMTWNGDLIFSGAVTRDLHLGNGPVALAAPMTLTATTVGRTLTVGGAISGGNGIFDVTKAGAGAFVYNPATVLAANQAVTVSAGTETLNGAISGSGFSLTKNGAGTLSLNGANSYDGGTVVNAGTIQFGAGAVPAGGLITLKAGGVLNAVGAYANAGAWVASGKIAPVSAGVLALTGADSSTIDFSTGAYGFLSLGASVAATFAGAITPGPNGFVLGGGGATLTVSAANALTGAGNVTVAGNLTVTAANSVSGPTTVTGGTLTVAGTTGALANSDIVVNDGGNTALTFDSSTSGVTGATRAKSVTLKAATLTVRGNNGTGSVDTVTGALVCDIAAPWGPDWITVTPGSKNAKLAVGALIRTNNAIAIITGTSLGAAPGAGIATVVSATDLTTQLVGGNGAAGSSNISILPWAIGSTTAGAAAASFVTYDAVNGIRPLNTATEYATSIVDGSSSDGNIRLSGGGTVATINSPTTINSLYIVGNAANTTVAGSSTLTVNSGHVYLGANATTAINAGLNFGARQGIIASTYNKVGRIGGPVSGSGGLVIYQAYAGTGSAGIDFATGASSSTYTGDTYVLGCVEDVRSGFLPSGSRTGDVHVYNKLALAVGTFTFNGLFGSGTVYYSHTSAASLTVGDNNADGLFSGTFVNPVAGSAALSLTKTGAGTLILSSPNNAYRGATTINGGVLSVTELTDGGLPSSIGVSANSAANLVLAAGTLRYTGTGAQTDRLFQLNGSGGATVYTNTLDASGTGALSFTNTGVIALSARGNRILALTGSNTNDNRLSLVLANGSGSTASTNALVKNGPGKWILTAVHSYTGPTTVNGGTLVVNGGLVSPVTVNSDAVLAGTGWIATNGAALTVNAGGVVDPGAVGSVGTLSVTGNVSFAGGQLRVDLAGANADLLAISGNVTAGGPVTVTVAGIGNDGPWKILTAANIAPAFTSATTGYRVSKIGTTELWLYRAPTGTAIILR